MVSKQRLVQQRMLELIRRQQDTQQSVRLFCAYHQISQSCYYYWLRKYRSSQPQQSPGSGFTLVHSESGYPGSVFCEWISPEGGRLRFFQPVAASYLKSLMPSEPC